MSVESRKTICALTMVWMFGLAVPSMAGVRALVEASVIRRPPRPPPEAVLKELKRVEGEVWTKTDRGRLEQRAEIPLQKQPEPSPQHASPLSSSASILRGHFYGRSSPPPRSILQAGKAICNPHTLTVIVSMLVLSSADLPAQSKRLSRSGSPRRS